MNKTVESYISLVEFLGKSLGSQYEIVLHDLTNLESSVIAIVNGEISGRKVGAPATDLVLKILQEEDPNRNYLCNYKGITDAGDEINGSTYYIKEDGKIVGMLCINVDTRNLLKLKSLIDGLLLGGDNNEKEFYSKSSSDLTLKSIHDVIASYPVEPSRMSYEEKLEVIKELDSSGIFLIKGAVNEVARLLKTSVPSVYRYLKTIKTDSTIM